MVMVEYRLIGVPMKLTPMNATENIKIQGVEFSMEKSTRRSSVSGVGFSSQMYRELFQICNVSVHSNNFKALHVILISFKYFSSPHRPNVVCMASGECEFFFTKEVSRGCTREYI